MISTNLTYIKLLFGLIIVWLLASCNNEVTNKLEAKGTALGTMNEIVVVADDALWESAVGDTFRYYFESAYPILPQPEPLFDLRHFSPQDLQGQPLRKELRTYTILADLSDADSETTKMVKKDLGSEKFDYATKPGATTSSVGRDKWARGQLLVYLYAPDRTALSAAIKKSFPAITKKVHEHDKKQLRSTIYVDRANLGLSEKVRERFHIDFQVPGDFVVATDDIENNVLWMRKVGEKADQNIVLQRFSYDDEAQLSKQGIINMRDKFGRTYVTSDEEDDFMVVDEDVLPVYEYSFTLDNHYGKELRGIWEMTNAFSGGPFNTYVILNEAKRELIYVDVFVLAPGTTKRDHMMQLDHIVKTARIVS